MTVSSCCKTTLYFLELPPLVGVLFHLAALPFSIECALIFRNHLHHLLQRCRRVFVSLDKLVRVSTAGHIHRLQTPKYETKVLMFRTKANTARGEVNKVNMLRPWPVKCRSRHFYCGLSSKLQEEIAAFISSVRHSPKISFFLISGTAVCFNPDNIGFAFWCICLFLCLVSFESSVCILKFSLQIFFSVFKRLYSFVRSLECSWYSLLSTWWFCIWILEWKFYSERCIPCTRNSTFRFWCRFNIVLSPFVSKFELVFFVFSLLFLWLFAFNFEVGT